jgi:hypothetical protein
LKKNLIFFGRADLGKIFNLYNPHRVQFDYVVDKLEEHAKLKLERLAYIDWKTQILPKLGKSLIRIRSAP